MNHYAIQNTYIYHLSHCSDSIGPVDALMTVSVPYMYWASHRVCDGRSKHTLPGAPLPEALSSLSVQIVTIPYDFSIPSADRNTTCTDIHTQRHTDIHYHLTTLTPTDIHIAPPTHPTPQSSLPPKITSYTDTHQLPQSGNSIRPLSQQLPRGVPTDSVTICRCSIGCNFQWR